MKVKLKESKQQVKSLGETSKDLSSQLNQSQQRLQEANDQLDQKVTFIVQQVERASSSLGVSLGLPVTTTVVITNVEVRIFTAEVECQQQYPANGLCEAGNIKFRYFPKLITGPCAIFVHHEKQA